MRKLTTINGLLTLATVALISSCGKTTNSNFVSEKTGWNFNDPKLGGFDVAPYNGQVQGPGLQFVEGGTFTMGQTEEDLTQENNNTPHRVTVNSFYMDETEVANIHYREYTYWLSRVYGSDYPELIQKAMPDTTCWRQAMSYNEPMVENYFRHGGYSYYPVVGVTWNQANDYCKWRTDRVNELILIKMGYLKKNPNQVSEDNFNLKSYLANQYEGSVGVKKRDIDPTGGGRRNIRLEDGITLPDYRLPTEAEWEYAALALIENNPDKDQKRRRGEEVVTDRKVYPWGGPDNSTREELHNQYQGEFQGNFKRGAGDMGGVAGGLNDNSFYPAPIYSYKPNAYGLYNMAGNVSEWVMDVYRPNTPMDAADFNPFRGNVFDTYKRLDDGTLEEKDSLGHMPKRLMKDDELADNKLDYRTANVVDYADGDTSSSSRYEYAYSKDRGTTLINDAARVVKGGSWNDRAYWLSPGTRRFYQENHTSATIGFRCALDRIGSPSLNSESGNYFGKKKTSR